MESRGGRVGLWLSSLDTHDQGAPKTKKYGEAAIQVTAEMFGKCANELQEKVMEKDGAEQNAWILSATFCSTRYRTEGRYLVGYSTLEADQLNKPRETKVQFFQRRSPSPPKDFRSFIVLTIQVLPNIVLGVKLLRHYENKYEVHGCNRT